MADRYIDYLEVGEYGDHFVSQSQKLDGLSPLVDVPALRQKVQAAIDATDAELGNIGVHRGALRTDRDAAALAASEGKDMIQRFYYTLLGLPKSSGADVEAFFPGRLLGELAGLKPDDVKGRLNTLLKGFDTQANQAAAAALGSWKQDLQAGRDQLAAALAGKGGSQGTSITGTAALNTAREAFLRVYNKVAKKLVAGLLADLGREEELKLFFKDLAVQEGGKAKKSSTDTGAQPPPGDPTTPGGQGNP